jgi:tetratricopeptide (TPR) repeat protein
VNIHSSAFRVGFLLSILAVGPSALLAQRGKGGSGNTSTGNGLPTQPNQPTTTSPSLLIMGKVLLEGGGPPPEAVVIESVCNGTARRQGYTDNKGSFQFRLDQDSGFQDASENRGATDNTSSPVASGVNQATKSRYQGCEVRAVLAGFVSDSVALRLQGNDWQYNLGNIFLKHMEEMPGTTISMTTLNAPENAKKAYEKGRKAFDEGKFTAAEKELNQAVKVYPNFAAAWSLLGDMHQQQKQFEQAINEYSRALAADPRFVNPSFGLALIAMQQKRWQDASQLTDQVVKMNSAAYPSAYFYNAIANYNLGKIDAAEVSARRFKTLDTEHRHPDVSFLLGQIDIQKNDLGAAAQEMRDYVALAPDAPNAEQARQWLKHYEDTDAAK